jgi:copper chaperone
METLKFKTNVSCGGCIAKVTPYLDQVENVSKWSVDTSTPLKILTVETDGIDPDEIAEVMKAAGYKAELIDE